VSEEGTSRAEKPRKFQAIRGTRDLLPPDTSVWNHVEQVAREVFGTFNFGEIRLPVFEPTDLFARAVGGETDIVSKEMYTFVDEEQKLPNPAELDVDPRTYAELVESAVRTNQLPPTVSNQAALEHLRFQMGLYEARLKEDAIEAADLKFRVAASRLQFGESISLRPEATASVCRAYIEHGMQQLPQPVKLYYMGPMFRRERPQKGRYRQFYQIGAEVLGGSDAPAIDAEVVEMLMTFFDRIELTGATLHINSIGHNAPNCRPAYVELLRTELIKVTDQLGEDSQRRIETNPLRVLDSKVEKEQAIIAKLPHIADHLCAECAAHYKAVKHELELRGIFYTENWRLVRGLDYYMRTTFEIIATGLGSQNAVCGGGRYDGLVEILGGPPTKGIGFAIGEDRLILSLQESGKGAATQGCDVYVAWMGDKTYATAVRAAHDLRHAGFVVELPPVAQKFGKALGQADRLGAKYALILGEDEVAEGLWTLKALSDGSQIKVPEPSLIEHLKREHQPRHSRF
jgi:histidyl-tRNA synthetase